jgi:hypothetical protein
MGTCEWQGAAQVMDDSVQSDAELHCGLARQQVLSPAALGLISMIPRVKIRMIEAIARSMKAS